MSRLLATRTAVSGSSTGWSQGQGANKVEQVVENLIRNEEKTEIKKHVKLSNIGLQVRPAKSLELLRRDARRQR